MTRLLTFTVVAGLVARQVYIEKLLRRNLGKWTDGITAGFRDRDKAMARWVRETNKSINKAICNQ